MKHILTLALCLWFVPQVFCQSTCVAVKPPELPKGIAKIWGKDSSFWPQKSTLRVRFLEGSARQKAAAWQRFADIDALTNLTFVQVTKGTAEIRVRFNMWNGHWSYVGTGSGSVPSNAETMNLALGAAIIGGDTQAEWDRVALHEILHAIGFEHEHQSPKGSIPWNKPAVYEYYGRTQGWSRQQVDYQVLQRYTGSQYRGTAFDPTSIMMYPVPASLTTNGFSVGWNAKLSATDIAFIRKTYPNSKL